MDRIELMKAFRAVAEEGSFVAAADRLERSNKQLSKQVAALEAELGVTLLHRTTRRVQLTEIGRAFLEQCSVILEQQAQLWSAVQSENQEVRGLLRISAPLSFGELKVAPALPSLLAKYPKLKLQMDLTDQYVDLVASANDVAVRIGSLEDSSLIARRIGETGLVLVASPQYLNENGTPNTPNDLRAHSTIVDRNYRGRFQWPFVINGKATKMRVDARIEVNSPEAAKRFALSHCGITMCPNYMVETEINSGELVSVLSENMPDPMGIHIVYPSNKHLAPNVRAFSDHMAQQMRTGI